MGRAESVGYHVCFLHPVDLMIWQLQEEAGVPRTTSCDPPPPSQLLRPLHLQVRAHPEILQG